MRPPFYVWQEDYQAAVLEIDPAQLASKIAKAEPAIQERKTQLLKDPEGSADELEAIARALRVVSILKEITQKTTASFNSAEGESCV